MERCNNTYEELAKDTDIKFPDDSSWTDMANLGTKIMTWINYFINNTEKRDKFLILLNSIHKNFVTFMEAMDKHFDVLIYEIGRLDFQQEVEDPTDKLSRRYNAFMENPFSVRDRIEFMKSSAMDPPDKAMLNLQLIVTKEPMEQSFIWKALAASNGSEKLLQYWKIMVTSTCHKLVNVHSQYRSLDKVAKSILEEEIQKMRDGQKEMEKRFEEIDVKRKVEWK